MNDQTEIDWEMIAKIGHVYSPAAPIDRRALFAGRSAQLARVMQAATTRGLHVAIFGERGVGKTSLANIVKAIYANGETVAVKVNCTKGDDFVSLWRKAFSEVEYSRKTDQATIGFQPGGVTDNGTADAMLSDSPDPHEIRRLLERLGNSIIVFDEFDRLKEKQGQSLFSDTIKTLSDYSVSSTIILVGVAQNIDELIKEHQSVERSLRQILMPRMDIDELEEIVTKANDELGMTIDSNALELVVVLSHGLPHYTHLLGKASSEVAVREGRKNLTLDDVRAGISAAIDDTQQSIRSMYHAATTSARKDTLFAQVLLACALVDVDELGYFTSPDVRGPLSDIMGKPYDIPNYSQHLDKFSSDARGNVLEKKGTRRRFRFRFANPLLQPFVIMRGLNEGVVSGKLIHILKDKYSRAQEKKLAAQGRQKRLDF